ncbi:stress-response A/B barrel domain-containing protein UP3 [Diospyros lotus]|uniref:stress-response A/B barrel domain-containing protein UP3 n=1 Tax=Diospyros lotus TaxID=55363 RepID=UPI002253DF77|nr:stress-response A/B barrel domain-containing protein UP3 [Diospyros lotus]
MSAQIVEHIVLFKVKPETDPSKIDSMVAGLAGLSTLDPVLHLSVGPLHRNRSPAFSFTHMLHSRYKSKDDLDAYSGHPAHVSVVTERVRPICEDVMAVDWVSDGLAGPVAPRVGSAMRVTFLKLKEGLGEKERGEVLSVIGGVKDGFPATEQISYGENFSPARAKGFSIGSIAVLPGVSELEALDADSDLAESMKNKVRDLLESVIVLDYVIPQQQSASL